MTNESKTDDRSKAEILLERKRLIRLQNAEKNNMSKVLVFIAAPYSTPSMSENVHRSAHEFDWMMKNLGDRVIPVSLVVASHMHDLIFPKDYNLWLDHCIDMLKKCDIMYVVPGKSSGKDKEIEVAKSLGIPITYRREELVKYIDSHPEMLDNDIDRIKREIGGQLYDAKRKGTDIAALGLSEAKKIATSLLSSGSKAVASQAIDFIKPGKKK